MPSPAPAVRGRCRTGVHTLRGRFADAAVLAARLHLRKCRRTVAAAFAEAGLTPYIPHLHTHDGLEMDSVPDLMTAVCAADCVVIVTNHSTYDYPSILAAPKFIFASRNALGSLGRDNPKVERL